MLALTSSLLLAAILLSPHAQEVRQSAARQVSNIASLQARVRNVTLRLGMDGEIRLQQVPAGDPRDGLREGAKLYIAEPTLQSGGTEWEDDALLVILLMNTPEAAHAKASIPSQLIALGVTAAATALDPPDRRDPAQRYKPVLGVPRNTATTNAEEGKLAARVIADVEQVGSCTGPLHNVLVRLISQPSVAVSVRKKANAILNGAGTAFYPGSFTCIN